MITTCPACNGKKEVRGLGCIIKECAKCHGIGHIKQEKLSLDMPAVNEGVHSIPSEIDTKQAPQAKKRGRKPKKETLWSQLNEKQKRSLFYGQNS